MIGDYSILINLLISVEKYVMTEMIRTVIKCRLVMAASGREA